MQEIKAKVQDPTLDWLEDEIEEGLVGIHLTADGKMLAIPYHLHHSSLLQALLDDTDVAFKTLWALLIMMECRRDLLFVATDSGRRLRSEA
jgi:hypothetical protein